VVSLREGSAVLIGLDCDGILADLMPYWLEFYNRDYQDCLKNEHLTAWETHTLVKPECGFKVYEYLERPGFLCEVPLMPGAQQGVARLLDMGHEIVVVTDTPAKSVSDRLLWLRTHFAAIPEQNYIITPRKDLVRVDLLVDDAPCNIVNARCPYVIFDHPYNQGVPGPRVTNWQQLVSYIERFEP